MRYERFVQDHCWLLSRQQVQRVKGSQAMPNMYNPVLMLGPSVTDFEDAAVFEGTIDTTTVTTTRINVQAVDRVWLRPRVYYFDNKVSHNFTTVHVPFSLPSTSTTTTSPITPPTTVSTTTTLPPTTTTLHNKIYLTTDTATSTNVQVVDNIEVVPFRGDSNPSYRHSWQFRYNLPIQLTVVLLVTSLVVFSFLRFKQSSKARGAIDHELEELVIKHQTFATDDNNTIDPHNTDRTCEKEKSQIATVISKSDQQIEAKLPDVINSRN